MVPLLLALAMGACDSCDSDSPTVPTPTAPTPAATPTPQTVTPTAVAVHTTPAEENNGLKVEIIHDEWGGGHGVSCHANGGRRTFRLTNESDVKKYSRLSAFVDDTPMCGTQKTETGTPNHGGCTEIEPGQTCEFWVEVTFPKGTDGICTLQVDDTWGPGDFREGSFVVGDSFKVPDSKCEKICIEDPVVTVEEGCGDWTQCPEPGTNPEECYRERTCWKKTTTDYQCKPDVSFTEEWPETDPCDCTLECVDTPTGSVTYDASGNPLVGNATFEDSGTWKLRIHASRVQLSCLANTPDYWKRTVEKTIKCDEQGALEATYSWRGHGAEWWRVVLYRNGSLVDQSDCFRNTFN
jgi:hypothetical protein